MLTNIIGKPKFVKRMIIEKTTNLCAEPNSKEIGMVQLFGAEKRIKNTARKFYQAAPGTSL